MTGRDERRAGSSWSRLAGVAELWWLVKARQVVCPGCRACTRSSYESDGVSDSPQHPPALALRDPFSSSPTAAVVVDSLSRTPRLAEVVANSPSCSAPHAEIVSNLSFVHAASCRGRHEQPFVHGSACRDRCRPRSERASSCGDHFSGPRVLTAITFLCSRTTSNAQSSTHNASPLNFFSPS